MANPVARSALSRAARPEHYVGERIARYELLHPIAHGGMGSVWAARLHDASGGDELVAIKTALSDLAAEPRVRAMFLNEARLASAVDHRNVARILDFFEYDGELYLVMEWIRGVSLKTLQDILAARGERLPDGILLRVAADICAGLHAAHEVRDPSGASAHLVHRDVSPHNIVVGVDGVAKLIDFGVAKVRDCAAQETTFGMLKGKPPFMAPEQARAERVDRRADIWSVGAVIFYLLAGSAPFEMNERSDTLRQLLAGTPVRSLPEDVDPTLARIVDGCLAHWPEDRFQTAADVGQTLEMAIEDLGLGGTASDVAAFVQEHAREHLAQVAAIGRLHPESVTTSYATDAAASSRGTPGLTRRTLALIAAGFCLAPIATIAVGRANDALTHAAEPSPVARAASVVRVEPAAAIERPRTEAKLAPAYSAPVALPSALSSAPAPPRRAEVRATRRSPKARPIEPPSAPPAAFNRESIDGFGSAVETRK